MDDFKINIVFIFSTESVWFFFAFLGIKLYVILSFSFPKQGLLIWIGFLTLVLLCMYVRNHWLVCW